jgi:response regulator RpfG family c-di-GMP phosphodiesterase
VRTSLISFFEDFDYKIYYAENGEDALNLLSSNLINAVIVDVRLPGMDGTEFVKKAVNLNDNTVFIFHTGSPEFVFPESLIENKRVSKHVFYKPVYDLFELNSSIISLIKECE